MALRDQFDPHHAANALIAENRQRHLDVAEWIVSFAHEQHIKTWMLETAVKSLLASCSVVEGYLATLPAPVPEPEPILPGPDLSAERMASFSVGLDDDGLLDVKPRGKKKSR